MRCVTALSQHPVAAEATAEVVGQVLDAGLDRRDLVVLFCSAHHVDAFAAVTSTVRQLLSPARLVGTTAGGVLGGEREVEDGPALSLWAADLGRVPAPVRLTAASTPSGVAIQGLPPDGRAAGRTIMLVADPFSLPVSEVLDVFAAGESPTPVVGGLASAGLTPGGNRLALDGDVYVDGAVGLVLDGVDAVVSQGCRPVGSPMIVTKSDGNALIELAGKSALSRLEQVANQIPTDERALLANGVHLGVVADEHQAAFERGDFLVRSVVGADRERGALHVGALLDVGTTVQFHVRDASSADEDLRELLATRRETAGGALVFTCNGRGRQLFGTSHHDASLVADVTKDAAVAGMFCAGEIGPVGGRSFLHGFTACVLLFHDRPGEADDPAAFFDSGESALPSDPDEPPDGGSGRAGERGQ
jgi:small ligand-binding sensory domain FIST